ncbi:MAG: alpha/beta hydrolase [Polyangiales bacterium]
MAFRLPAWFLRGIMRLILKPFLGPPLPVGFQRFWLRLTSNANAPSRRALVERLDIDGMSSIRACPRDAEPRQAVLYLHGGGYCVGSWGSHKGPITHLAVAANAEVYAPNYRLAPEHPYPAAVEDALGAYRWLLAKTMSPERIALAGDSAGGGLAFATAIAIRDAGLPAPSSVALISPWVDLSASAPAIEANAKIDPMLRPSWTRSCSAMYRDGLDSSDPGCSPLFASHRGLPPVLIQTGSDEIIVDDSIRLDARCREAGVDVTLQVFEGMWHDFQSHAGILEEGDEAMSKIAEFLNAHWR